MKFYNSHWMRNLSRKRRFKEGAIIAVVVILTIIIIFFISSILDFGGYDGTGIFMPPQ